MTISRRSFIAGTALAVAAPFKVNSAIAADENLFPNALRIPPLLQPALSGDKKVFDLVAAPGKSEFFDGILTPTIGFNGNYLGPTIRVRAGDHVALRVKNALPDQTTVHWHGLHIPARSDGGPHQIIEPGSVWEPSFEIRQKASLCWYHSHLMGQTGEQVLRGLAGLFLIEDDESKALDLPVDYGVDDIPLVIQDRRFRRDGRFDYLSSMHDVMAGYKGDVILVNGTVAPHVVLRRQRTRLRVLNGSNSRIYTLGRDDGADLVIVGSDGSLLEQSVMQRRLRLGPGERAELLIDMEIDQQVRLMSYPDVVNTRQAGPGMMMGGMSGNTETLPILELRAARLETIDRAMPTKLIRVSSWSAAQAARTRTFTLDMAMMGMGGMMGRGGMGAAMGINGRPMSMDRIDFKVPLGSTEIWEIRNTTPLTHPFHIHGIQFRVLDRDGAPPLPQELGLKDTVLVDAGSAVRVIIEFSDYADSERPYMYHCHILEHEDAGMMGQFVVV
ncbi:MAG: multicopper oxidase domain-containing protein [Afipia sp.]|nr:multicopper oxidase domain-containing protein [Afipia sp.]